MKLEQILEAITALDNNDFVALANKLDAQRQKRAQDILNKANAQAQLLSGSKKISSVRAPKYADPTSGKTWSGQGRQPKWFADYLAQGGKEEDLLIK